MADVPREVVDRRVRNRIIEYLELAASFADQREYQAKVPHVPVSAELIVMWEDWFIASQPERYGPPTYTAEEREALLRFHALWDEVADRTPNPLPEIYVAQSLPEWHRLRDGAEQALRVLQRRGKLPED